MEFEDVSAEVEWGCRRVAAAFGLAKWCKQPTDNPTLLFFERKLESEGVNLDLMARGLYRLEFEAKEKVEDVLSQLPELTAHEKLELRPSFPREFWPQKWLDEEEMANRLGEAR